jgi:hypothetical protein
MTFGYLWTLLDHVCGINDPEHTCDEYLVLASKPGMTLKLNLNWIQTRINLNKLFEDFSNLEHFKISLNMQIQTTA